MKRFSHALVAGSLLAAIALAVPPVTGAQEQPPTRVPGWPCGARLDPTYYEMAEATGGQAFMIAPDELGRPDTPLPESGDHRQTIFRLLDTMTPGARDFRVPIESFVESVVFTISVQCLQTADVVRPSGAPLVSGAGVTVASSRAIRSLTVKQPEPGVWTLRVAGTGVASVMVQAQSNFGADEILFAAVGSTDFTRRPVAGVENSVVFVVSDRYTEVKATIVDRAFRVVAPLPLEPDDATGFRRARFTPGAQGFRVLIEGKDADGVPFQRVQAALITAR